MYSLTLPQRPLLLPTFLNPADPTLESIEEDADTAAKATKYFSIYAEQKAKLFK